MSRRKRERQFEVIDGEGKNINPWQDKVMPAFTICVVVFLVSLVFYQWVYNWLYFRRVQIAVAEPGVLESVLETRGVITRHEKVINSPGTGLLQGGVTEGERVAVNGDVVVIVPGARETTGLNEGNENTGINLEDYWATFRDMITYYLTGEEKREVEPDEPIIIPEITESIVVQSPRAGMVSYRLDGFEHYCYPDIPYQRLFTDSKTYQGEIYEPDIYIEKGKPLFKIVDNQEWFFTVEVDIIAGRRVVGRQNADIVFSFAPDLRTTAEMIDYEADLAAEIMYITYRLTHHVPGFSRHRWADAKVFYQAHRGIVIPRSSLVEREDETGVFINARGTVVFVPVVIVYYTEDAVIVEGLEEDSVIIARPGLVTEGQRLE